MPYTGTGRLLSTASPARLDTSCRTHGQWTSRNHSSGRPSKGQASQHADLSVPAGKLHPMLAVRATARSEPT